MNTLPYKSNWSETEARMTAWWKRKNIDRVSMSIGVPRIEKSVIPQPKNDVDYYSDPEFVTQLFKATFESAYYIAETLPNRNLMIGYTLPGAFMGQEPFMNRDTVWFKHTNDPLESLNLDFDQNNIWWQRAIAVQKALLKFTMPGIPIFIQPMDVISMILGAERTCIELIERPELVKECRDKLTVTFKKMFNESYDLIQTKYEGSFSWLPVWSKGKTFPLQCDFSCMISVDMFEEFVAPELENLSNFLDNSIYHLDGVNALHHVPRLLQFKKLDAIQWVPGAGKPIGMYWESLYKQILESGKGVYIYLSAKEVELALKKLPHEGLWIQTDVRTLKEAEELIKLAEKYN